MLSLVLLLGAALTGARDAGAAQKQRVKQNDGAPAGSPRTKNRVRKGRHQITDGRRQREQRNADERNQAA